MSHASSSKVCKYGVFLSFRGIDTRRNFVSHLYNALEQRGIDVFKDDERLETGKSIPNELMKAIEESRFAIVIFSESYASSRWCLEELAHIIKCRNELDQIVIPIFYDVSPSDVSHQNSPFAESFSKYKDDELEKVQRWREACKEAGKISGYHLQECKDEANCIKKVVDHILPNIISTVSESLVGTQIEKVISLLHMKSDDVYFVGLWGMSGIGKTEIASVIYERYRHQFEAYCFLGDVGEMYRKKGLRWLQKTLICKLFGKKMIVTSEHDGTTIIKNGLRWKKVLLVLDNIDHLSQLELIVGGTEWFGRGSRILITTRDKHLIVSHVKEDKVYEVLLLSENEALELFCMHAFKRKSPERDFKVLSNEVVKYADGLPLALKVLGSSLYGRNKEQCRDIIDRLKRIPNDDILGKLKIGLDGLNNDEMRTFLDIACLYNHEYSYYVERILKSCGIHLIGISYLIEKSLLCIRYHSFEMHSLISQTGQNVSREEYANSRVWLIEEVHDLFAGKLKTKKVESLRIPNGYRFDDDHINYNKVFKRMQCLQVLILHRRTICSESTVTCLPSNLRWIEWPNYPSSSLPEGFEPSQLVGLCLRGSWLVELWPIPKKLCNLKYLNLSESLGLTKTPNFGDMPNLETLSLRRCENLEVVHPYLGHCKMLTYLSLTGCVKLKKLPKFVCMESLEILLLDECTSLKRFPKICGDMRRLSILYVESPWIRSLPPSLSGLSRLKLKGCEVLESIPDSILNLERLHISGCNKLTTLPNSLFESQQWIFLYIYRCSGLVELPVSLGVQKKLGFLSVEECENLTKLPSSIQMESLTELKISNCPKLTTFPEIIGDMHCLKSLTLESTGIRELPLSIGNLSGLEYLNLKGCEDLVSLSNSLCKLKNLQRLILRGCKKLPGNVGDLQEFETLEEPRRSSK
ncbi:TMV resistance protein N-like [Solanum tuberosum]|uniref:Nematode resistance protein n=1 Tax=Solanum tuberosum TaxID=4113 RepID=M1CVI4_SOLTU|nr:PREDICTED: TMV resistance protein N-like [Solanum tuberosum]